MPLFGETIRELRVRAGLTQSQVAEQIGVSNTYISALESGRKTAPPYALVAALSTSLGVDAQHLWSIARGEREDRLRQRIRGVPTSQRTCVADPPAPGDSRSERDDAEAAFAFLANAVKTPRERRLLARALEALAENLRKAG